MPPEIPLSNTATSNTIETATATNIVTGSEWYHSVGTSEKAQQHFLVIFNIFGIVYMPIFSLRKSIFIAARDFNRYEISNDIKLWEKHSHFLPVTMTSLFFCLFV